MEILTNLLSSLQQLLNVLSVEDNMHCSRVKRCIDRLEEFGAHVCSMYLLSTLRAAIATSVSDGRTVHEGTATNWTAAHNLNVVDIVNGKPLPVVPSLVVDYEVCA